MNIRRLHIGGKERKEGWEILNILPSKVVDHVGDARDLSRFSDATFHELYASHVLEHFDFRELELVAVLKEWLRVLVPGGRLYLSVPDMDILCALFLCKQVLSAEERYKVMRIMFGGHLDRYDYHLTGLNREFLEEFLRQAGFTTPLVVKSFDIFKDASNQTFGEIPISLNMIAKKPF